MLTPLPSPQRMNEWDTAAATLGFPTFTLMENAARAAWHVLHDCIADLHTCRVLILMGSGNNGGDAAALARMLHDEGIRVRVIHTRPLKSLRGIASSHTRLAKASGVTFTPVRHWLQPHPETYPAWTTPDVIIDGLLGTGFSGALSADMTSLINELNARVSLSHAFVLSLDVPSGLCANTGLAHVAIKANATVTFEAAKPGIVLPNARAYTGEIHTKSIGMPSVIQQRLPADFALLDAKILSMQQVHFPHKGAAGHVLILGGSTGLCGAPLLAAKGALAAGAGKVTIAMPAPLLATLSIPPDIMTYPLPAEYWQDSTALFDALQNILNQVDCLVLGPGIGRNEYSRAFVARLLQASSRPPSLIDADALYALKENQELNKTLTRHDILTPHPGEVAALLQSTTGAVQYERFASLAKLQATSLHNPVWVLKGAGTLIGQQPEARPYSNEEALQEHEGTPHTQQELNYQTQGHARQTHGAQSHEGQTHKMQCDKKQFHKEHFQTVQDQKAQTYEQTPSCLISPFDIPQLAVAGSGDVLAGIIACFMAQGIPAIYAAGLGVYRHATAGLYLAKVAPHRGNSASDIAQALRHAL